MVVLYSVQPTSVFAQANDSWLTQPIFSVSKMPSGPLASGASTCGGSMGIIEVKGQQGYEDACIFGDSSGTRVARYLGGDDRFAYAVAFLSDSSYISVRDFCSGMPRCMYGQAGDSMLIQEASGDTTFSYGLVKQFTKYLTLHNGVSPYYAFLYPGGYPSIQVGSSDAAVGVTSVSANGRWALIELPDYGFIRFDLQSMTYKRIAAHDSLFTQTAQRLESTISDDGRWAVITGYAVDSLLYEITDGCGDTLVNSSSQYFNTTTACNSVELGIHTLFPGPIITHVPRFSSDGNRLRVEIQQTAQFYTATLSWRDVGNGNPYYVAYGDSFTSGEGEVSDSFYIAATNTATNHCHVSTRSYPYLLGSSWEILTSNLACSGSQMSGIRSASGTFSGGQAGAWPSVVSIGAGGNDVDFMGKLKSCMGPGTCEWAKESSRATTANEIKGLLPKVIQLLADVQANMSPASLFIVGYPDVINDAANASCSLLIANLLDATERRYMSESIRYINAVLKAAAEYSHITFVDIATAYQGERLCDSHETAMNGIRYGDDLAPVPLLGDFKFIGAESFHPTPRGHELVAQTINVKLGSFWTSPYCALCIFSGTEVSPTAYWREGAGFDGPVLRQLAQIFLEPEKYVNGSDVSFQFLPNTFASGAAVRLEIHSDNKNLGVYHAADDGSLQGVLAIPEGVEGYHAVHAYGESRSGEQLDVYQTIYVANAEAVAATDDKGVDNEGDGIKINGVSLENRDADGENVIEFVRSEGVTAGRSFNEQVSLKAGQGSSEVLGESVYSKVEKSTNFLLWYGMICGALGLIGAAIYVQKKKKRTRAD